MTEEEKERVNCEGLRGTAWRLVTWSRPRPFWDHEHCRVCFRRIAELDYGDPEAIQDAYRFVYPAEPGDNNERDEWLCPACFDEYRTEFRWTEI